MCSEIPTRAWLRQRTRRSRGRSGRSGRNRRSSRNRRISRSRSRRWRRWRTRAHTHTCAHTPGQVQGHLVLAEGLEEMTCK